MKRVLVVGLAALSFAASADKLPFMPCHAPELAVPSCPPGYSNAVELACAAALKCNTLTNLADMSQAERAALMKTWRDNFTANGIPDEFRRKHVGPIPGKPPKPPHPILKDEKADVKEKPGK